MAIKKTGRLFYPPFFCRISYMTIATVGDWVLAVDFITYAEFINQITALIKKWNVVDQGNEILKDFHGYR